MYSISQFQEYFSQKKELYNCLLHYINNDESQYNDNYYYNLIDMINAQKINENITELKSFIHLIIDISCNHHRNASFFDKILNIFTFLEKDIKQRISNEDIFELCHKNKLILLLLIKMNIIIVDSNSANSIFNLIGDDNYKYYHFFYPEIKQYLNKYIRKNIKKELLLFDSNIFDNFQEKRENGQNDDYICHLIRNDCVEEFIGFINYRRIPLSKVIESSLFETNDFLIKNKPTLIEYAAFFGSIQIFRFLAFNKIELTPSLWLYVIHSNNAELIHFLENNNIDPPNDSYEICFSESIKCHHNEIAAYILYTFLNDENNFTNKTIKCIINHYNYEYFPIEINNNSNDFAIIYSLLKNDYLDFVYLYIKTKENMMINNEITNMFNLQ